MPHETYQSRHLASPAYPLHLLLLRLLLCWWESTACSHIPASPREPAECGRFVVVAHHVWLLFLRTSEPSVSPRLSSSPLPTARYALWADGTRSAAAQAAVPGVAKRGALCKSVGGLWVQYVLVSNPEASGAAGDCTKPVVAILARQHPGETVARCVERRGIVDGWRSCTKLTLTHACTFGAAH